MCLLKTTNDKNICQNSESVTNHFHILNKSRDDIFDTCCYQGSSLNTKAVYKKKIEYFYRHLQIYINKL